MNSNLIFYACIAKGTTVLAEFISKDADLGDIALKCLGKTPQFHSVFSHTIRNKTYMFYIDDPFVYFGIFDINLEKSICVAFLKSVAGSFNHILDQNPLKRLTTLSPHCFQGEFSPVFHQLLSDLDGMDDVSKVVMSDESGSSRSVREKKVGLVPLLGGGGLEKNVMKKKKRRFFGERDPQVEKKVDVSSDDGISLSREFSLVNNHNKNGLLTADKAKHVWKKQLLMVLSLDFIVCCIMFGVWLGICRGFKCMSE